MRLLGALARLLAAALLITALSAGVSAYVAYVIIDGTPFTDPNPVPSAPPVPTASRKAGPVLVTTSPSPDASPSARTIPWTVGSCVSDWLPTTILECTTYKALRIVGTIHAPDRAAACADVPETTDVRYPGRYTLCLAPPG